MMGRVEHKISACMTKEHLYEKEIKATGTEWLSSYVSFMILEQYHQRENWIVKTHWTYICVVGLVWWSKQKQGHVQTHVIPDSCTIIFRIDLWLQGHENSNRGMVRMQGWGLAYGSTGTCNGHMGRGIDDRIYPRCSLEENFVYRSLCRERHSNSIRDVGYNCLHDQNM